MLEPMGTRPPKLISNAKMTWFEENASKDLALLCQAQGYPSPLFRYYQILYTFLIRTRRIAYATLEFGCEKHHFGTIGGFVYGIAV